MKKLFLILFTCLSLVGYGQETKSQLTTRFDVIRNETAVGGNTKIRVANAYQELLNGTISIYPIEASGTDNYTAPLIGLSGYSSRMYFVTFENTNTGPVTLSINSIVADNVRKWNGSAWVELEAGDIKADHLYKLHHDGVWFQIYLESGGGTALTFSNGLQEVTGDVIWNGDLAQNTAINGTGVYGLDFSDVEYWTNNVDVNFEVHSGTSNVLVAPTNTIENIGSTSSIVVGSNVDISSNGTTTIVGDDDGTAPQISLQPALLSIYAQDIEATMYSADGVDGSAAALRVTPAVARLEMSEGVVTNYIEIDDATIVIRSETSTQIQASELNIAAPPATANIPVLPNTPDALVDGYSIRWDEVNTEWDYYLPSSATTPGGADTNVQYNDGGNLSGEAAFSYDKTNNVLKVDKVAGDATAGLILESNSGVDIGLLGAANTANVTWYGSHNYDGATANTIASFGASKTLSSLSTSTYPSLTELSYVKGVTGPINTQFVTSASASTSGNITLDLNSQVQRTFNGSATFATAKTIALSNTTNALTFVFTFEVTNVAATLTVPADWYFNSPDYNTSVWTPPATGKYFLSGKWDSVLSVWFININGPYTH